MIEVNFTHLILSSGSSITFTFTFRGYFLFLVEDRNLFHLVTWYVYFHKLCSHVWKYYCLMSKDKINFDCPLKRMKFIFFFCHAFTVIYMKFLFQNETHFLLKASNSNAKLQWACTESYFYVTAANFDQTHFSHL